jgi:hypothetical protein
MFIQKSRYINTEQYAMKDRRGRTVNVVAVPNAPVQSILGYHQLLQGQRIDHLAANYTTDEAGSWRIAAANDKMLPESLTEQQVIAIPAK